MPKPEKAYPVRLAGTRSYAAAIAAIVAGDTAAVLREIGNPYDADALAVVTSDGATLGYVPRESWLRRAIVDEERGCAATIDVVESGAGVTIAVTLNDDGPIGTRDYVSAA